MLVAEIKRAILRELAVKGWGYVKDSLSDEGVRALGELIAEGALVEGDEAQDRFIVVITRKGLDQAEALHV